MNLTPAIRKQYTTEQLTALQAQRLAQEIAFAPVVFQISRLMVKLGVLEALCNAPEGLTMQEVATETKLSDYAVKILLESSLSIGTVLLKEGDRFVISKVGWFLLRDKTTRVNMDFIQEVCYEGLFHLEEALKEGKPAGLKVFGEWPTIYEGLSQLPTKAQEKWFAFDHYYSDYSFEDALNIIFKRPVKTLLDVGGNTGRFALKTVSFNPDVQVTIMDLPQQLGLMKAQIAGKEGADRIEGYPANLLDASVPFPKGFDVIWMSQFLDCFSEEEVTSILSRAAAAMDADSELYILEAYWDRQEHETGAYCLNQISVYFTAMANGNSKMYYSGDMIKCVERAGLKVESIYDNLGSGNSHTLFKVVVNG
ncbi:O-methyltransferase [Capnocytophaga sp. HP1101]